MEQTDWLQGAATNCDWLRKSRHCQNLIEKFAFRGTKHHSESSNSIRKSWNVLQNQRAKKVVSDSPGLVDFATGLVKSVFNLPDGKVMFFEEFE